MLNVTVRSQVLPLEGKVSPQATEEVTYRAAASFDGCKSGTKITSSVIRLAGDAGCHPPLKGRDFTRNPFRRTQKRDEFHPVLPLEGKVSPQATEEVSYRKAVSFDECKSGTKITSPVIRLAGDAGCHPPLKGRDLSRVASSLPPADPCCCPPAFRRAERYHRIKPFGPLPCAGRPDFWPPSHRAAG